MHSNGDFASHISGTHGNPVDAAFKVEKLAVDGIRPAAVVTTTPDARRRSQADSIQMLTPELTQAISFYIFAAMVLAGAILTITRRNAVHSAMFLIVSLMGVAGLYLLQQAEFLFAVQIVLYIGGIMVLFLFVIMLVNLDQAAK